MRTQEIGEKEGLNEQEAAEFVGLSARTLFTLRKEKKVPYRRIRGRIVYSREALREWLRQEDEGENG
jgi:hypothetical protein